MEAVHQRSALTVAVRVGFAATRQRRSHRTVTPAPSRAGSFGLRPGRVGGRQSRLPAGLLGVGGGIVLTPGLAFVGRLPVKHAVATSLTTVAFMSVSALITHVALGHVDWRFAVPLALGIVPGARLGASITIGASERTMRLVAGSLLLAIGVIYFGREFASLLG